MITIGLFGTIGITKCDLIDEKLTHDPSSIYSSEAINRLCGQFHEKSGIDLCDIIPLKLHVHERNRVTAVEVITIEALSHVTQQVSSVVSHSKIHQYISIG